MRDDLPHAMRDTARRLEPDVVRLAAGGVSRGTRMRRIERIVQILGSAVAVTVVFAGVALFGPCRTADTGGGGGGGGSGGGGGGANQTAASGAGNASQTATPSPSNTLDTATAPSTVATPQISGSDSTGILKTGLSGTEVTGVTAVPGRSYAAPH